MRSIIWFIPLLIILPLGIYLFLNFSNNESSIKKLLRDDCESRGYKYNDANLKKVKIENNLALAENLVCFPQGVQAGEGYSAFLKKSNFSWRIVDKVQPPLTEEQIVRLNREGFSKNWYKDYTF